MTDCKLVNMHMAIMFAPSSIGGALLSDPTKYRSIVGALQYITLTRPDVAFFVNCSFDHGLFISKSSSLQLQAFFDVDWASANEDHKSTSGYTIYMGPNLTLWASKKQKTIAHSSIESEYKVVAGACAELTWLDSLFGKLRIPVPTVPIL
ncbi:uncharacterized mitochondrial protein AtMg00810-like [Macadamia integrifolia]|uniref:uncharacterized mitochondrial protein AtMg00810-like n=1 Tax=Macadamia integrifolia TaxID=60698 RepID=UPI001C4FF4CF|nr:uncharacterized mitochondrial protein AtMg00810-like [Macadamia integrifolia]